MDLMDIQHRILLMDIQHWQTWSSCMLASYGRLAAGKGRHAYNNKDGVWCTCVFVEVAGSYEKNFNRTVSWDGV